MKNKPSKKNQIKLLEYLKTHRPDFIIKQNITINSKNETRKR